MNPESLRIILRTYSKGGINEDETVQLIEDLYNKTTINNYPYTPYWPQITYTDGKTKFQKYEITCKAE
jgi:ADP-glucose pyrophosphorylase